MRFLFCSYFLVTSVILVRNSEGARILGFVPTPSHSHQVVFQPIWRELSQRGHQLVVFTTDPINDPSLQNLKEIDLSFAYELWTVKHNFTNLISMAGENLLKYIDKYVEMVDDIINQELQVPEARRLIEDPNERFDLVMLEYPYPLLTAFAVRFNCPFIGMLSLDAHSSVYDAVGNPSHPVLNPDFSLPISGRLTFEERLTSVFFQIYIRLYVEFYSYPKGDSDVRKHFGEQYPALKEIATNVSLLFVNVDPIFHAVRPTVPAVIQIGGGTHMRPIKKLPDDLARFLDSANEGFIYFSLGTNMKSKALPEETLSVLLETFSELPYKILWKFEGKPPTRLPKNVFLSKWLPQQDVLRHPNVKLFVTQGGLQSMEEAIYSHVPLIGIPFFGDQHTNVALIVAKGFGLSLDRNSIKKDTLKAAVLEVINNPKYRLKVKELAEVALDQPMTGLEKAVWWTEYVIRHKGARYLRSGAIDLPLYQYFLLDVIGFCIIVIILKIVTVVVIVKALIKGIKFLFSKSKMKSE